MHCADGHMEEHAMPCHANYEHINHAGTIWGIILT